MFPDTLSPVSAYVMPNDRFERHCAKLSGSIRSIYHIYRCHSGVHSNHQVPSVSVDTISNRLSVSPRKANFLACPLSSSPATSSPSPPPPPHPPNPPPPTPSPSAPASVLHLGHKRRPHQMEVSPSQGISQRRWEIYIARGKDGR